MTRICEFNILHNHLYDLRQANVSEFQFLASRVGLNTHITYLSSLLWESRNIICAWQSSDSDEVLCKYLAINKRKLWKNAI